MSIDVHKIREDFPILQTKVNGKDLIYFDNGATTQKPNYVTNKIAEIHNLYNSNIHRGVHTLSQRCTDEYELARKKIQQFINAEHSQEIIFTSGATQSINTIAYSFGERYINEGDEVLISTMEHHANIVPWQMMCDRKKAKLITFSFNENGELELEDFKKKLSSKTKIVAVTHVSNTLGTVNPIKEIIDLAHGAGAKILIDAAQSIQHIPINVQQLDCDFLVFSGHKLYGPTGIGALYGKHQILNELPPYMGGGDMVDCVTFDLTTYSDLPLKFEAGTTNYIGAIGLAKAIEYLDKIGLQNIADYEHELLEYATNKLQQINGINFYGRAKNKGPIISFLLKDIHMLDTGMVLDKLGIAVRTGTHCTQPLMSILGISGTVRASMSFYNTKEEIDQLFSGLLKVQQMFG